jgi:hypothetical protein
MKRNDQGYVLILSMISLVLLSTLTGLLVWSTGSDVRRSTASRTEVQAYYMAEAGSERALAWFRSNYGLLNDTLVDTAPGTPPTVTDPLGRTYTVSVALTNGSPVVLNVTNSGTVTSHPDSYTTIRSISKLNLLTSFQSSLANQSISLGIDGSGNFSVMATLIRHSPERWRIDSVGTYRGERQAVSVFIEKLPLTPYVKAAFTSASPVDLTGAQNIDGRDHDINGGVVGGTGLPGVSITSNNPLPGITGSGSVISNVGGSSVTINKFSVHPSPLPENYPVNNSLNPNEYPTSPAAALGLDATVYQPYLDSLSSTSIPCEITGLVIVDINFPTGAQSGGGCPYSGTGILIIHNPRYDPRYFDPTHALYMSATSPIPGQTAEQYRADPLNQPRYFNYNANNTFKGIIIADSVGEIGPGITGSAAILGALISLDRVNGSVGTGQATIGYSTAAINHAIDSIPYTKMRGTFRHLLAP